MILSHKNRFVFIKTTKTGGTSLEIALSKFCGPDDVITPISPEDEALRRELGYPGPQNHKIPLIRSVEHYLRHRKWPRYYNHMSAVEVIRLAGQQVWDQYFTFCFERNPWDRAMSLFHWRNRFGATADLHEFVQTGRLSNLKRRGSQLYMDGDRVLVDRIFRYEKYDEELSDLSSILGLEEPLDAPRAKGGIRPRRQDVTFTQQDVDYIGREFRAEITRLGYSFEQTGLPVAAESD